MSVDVATAAVGRADLDPREGTDPRAGEVRACEACGRLQVVPALAPGAKAECGRCGAYLVRRVRQSVERSLALQWAALFLFLVAHAFPIMTLTVEGRAVSTTILGAWQALSGYGMSVLAAAVLLAGTLLPAVRILGNLYVLSSLNSGVRRPALATVFRVMEHARPWAMLEVYLLGLIVAYVKLGDMALVELGPTALAFVALVVVAIAGDAVLEPADVWRLIGVQAREPDLARATAQVPAQPLTCHDCQQVVTAPAAGDRLACPRCGARLHRRKPESMMRTAALVATAAILYIPANLLPIMTPTYFAAGYPETILSGIVKLVEAGQYPIALLVLFASVLVPLLKLLGLSFLLISVKLGWRGRQRDRARLYHLIEWVGRWSMIDIFMIGILAAIVDHGNLATVVPQLGAVAFAAVVVITMLASMAFDPRLIWDVLDERGGDAGKARA